MARWKSKLHGKCHASERAVNIPCCGTASASGRSAAKSLSKTNVSAYLGFRTPPARLLPGHK